MVALPTTYLRRSVFEFSDVHHEASAATFFHVMLKAG